MNYTLQLHGERILYQVPPGLYELMSDMSREVLRDQPDNIYKYIANYIDTLLKLRNNARRAAELVDDVIGENKELFAYVDSLGLSWGEANDCARIIQRTFRTYKARKELKKRVEADLEERVRQIVPFTEHSPSFLEYFESLGVDYESASQASSVIQSAFRTYMARKQMKNMDRQSTHTIDIISAVMPVPLVLDRATTRDSKLLVYQQSPSPSINSNWYRDGKRSVSSSTTCSQQIVKRPFGRDSKLLVFQQSPNSSVGSGWFVPSMEYSDISLEQKKLGSQKRLSFLEETSTGGREKEVTSSKLSRTSNAPSLEAPLPSYYDSDQSKVPMISETGQLDVLAEDVVTLFSTDTFKTSKTHINSASDSAPKDKVETFPSLKDIGGKSSKTESEVAEELFSIIEKKPSKLEKFIDSAGALEQASKAELDTLHRISIISRSQKSEDKMSYLRLSQISHKLSVSTQPRTSSRMKKLSLEYSDESRTTEQQ